jgi:hypothetical protein
MDGRSSRVTQVTEIFCTVFKTETNGNSLFQSKICIIMRGPGHLCKYMFVQQLGA